MTLINGQLTRAYVKPLSSSVWVSPWYPLPFHASSSAFPKPIADQRQSFAKKKRKKGCTAPISFGDCDGGCSKTTSMHCDDAVELL